MVVDSSALIAVLQREPGFEIYSHAIAGSPVTLIATATLFETSMVILSRQGEIGVTTLRSYLDFAGAEIVPVDERHAAIALDAFRTYGKGRHRAGLNMGDCFTYALAKATAQPLLFKGDDFIHTDLTFAV